MSLSWENLSNHSVRCGEWTQEKTGFFEEEGVGGRKVIRNPPDLLLIDPTRGKDEHYEFSRVPSRVWQILSIQVLAISIIHCMTV